MFLARFCAECYNPSISNPYGKAAMRIQKLTLKISVFFFTFFLTAQCLADHHHTVFAFSDNTGTFERRDVQKAVNKFCRTLSLDPKNKTARENLSLIIAYPGLTAIQKADALLLEDLLGFIGDLQRRVDYLTSKRNLLKDRLIARGYDAETLSKNLLGIRHNISRSSEAFSYRKTALSDRKNALALMNTFLMKERMQLSVRLRFLQEQYNWLKAAGKGRPYTPSYDPAQPASVVKQEYRIESPSLAETETGKEIRTIAEVVSFQPSDTAGKVQESSLQRFKKELGLLYVQLDRFEEDAGKKDSKIKELSKQVVDLSLRLSETEMLLNKKIEAVGSLTRELDDIKQRFMLGQRIIQEKDAQMQSLQETLQEAHLGSGDRKEEIGQIIALKKELADVQAQFESDQVIIREKSDQIAALRNELQSMQDEVKGNAEYANVLLVEKDREIKELNGILSIYQQSLGDASRAIKEKGSRLDSLRDEVVRLQKSLAVEKAFLRVKERQD